MVNCCDSLPVGVVVRKTPGITRWASWVWKAVAVLPGAGPADWQVMRREGDSIEYHAETLRLELHKSDIEAYLTGLSSRRPVVYVVFRTGDTVGDGHDVQVLLVTASPYEAQDYMDSGEEIVEPVPMPAALVDWVGDFVEKNHKEEVFIKRRRQNARVDLQENGRGDPRIEQATDVYRAPGHRSGRVLQ